MMTRTDWLIVALVVITLARIVQAAIYERTLIHLLNDLATMVGELFDVIGN